MDSCIIPNSLDENKIRDRELLVAMVLGNASEDPREDTEELIAGHIMMK